MKWRRTSATTMASSSCPATGMKSGAPLSTATYALAPRTDGAIEFQLSPGQAASGGKLVLRFTPVIGDVTKPKIALSVNGA
jgi:hypothetical protein